MSSWASIDTHSQGYIHHKQELPFLSESNPQREMVKFSKQFEGQLVPEWKEAFVDYWQLKKDLKQIHLPNSDTTPTTTKQQNNSFLSSLRNFSLFGHQHRNHGAIQVFSLSLSLLLRTAYALLFVYCEIIITMYMD
jgi:hypothetical protein